MKVPLPPGTAPKTSGFAVASLIFGIIGGLLALPFGYVALRKIKRSGGALRGRGMALAGVILGWIWLGLLVAGTIAALTSGPEDLPPNTVCAEFVEAQVTVLPCTSPDVNVYLKSEHPPGSNPETVCEPFTPVYTLDRKGRVECWAYI